MRTSIKFLGALAVAGLVAAGGSAYTASNTVAASVAGYGTNTVTGASVLTAHHNLAPDGVTILSTDLKFSSSQQHSIVTAGFGTALAPEGDLQSCIVDPMGTEETPIDPMTATCTYGTVTPYETATAIHFNVAVVANPAP
jgi:hypothetical protein